MNRDSREEFRGWARETAEELATACEGMDRSQAPSRLILELAGKLDSWMRLAGIAKVKIEYNPDADKAERIWRIWETVDQLQADLALMDEVI